MIMAFDQARVLAFESRRAKEMAELIRINGGEPFVAPALMEVPLEHNHERSLSPASLSRANST